MSLDIAHDEKKAGETVQAVGLSQDTSSHEATTADERKAALKAKEVFNVSSRNFALCSCKHQVFKREYSDVLLIFYFYFSS